MQLSPNENVPQDAQEAAKQQLWQLGILVFKLRPHQKVLYEFISGLDGLNHIKRVAIVSRQFGKSFVALLVAVEHALKNPRSRVLIVAPTAKLLRAALLPSMETILADAPAYLRPKFSALDNCFTFPNRSTIYLAGADADVDSLRGRNAHLVIVDEAGFISDLQGLIKNVILPMFISTSGKMVLISTPPNTPGHYLRQAYEDAKSKNASLHLTIHDNSSVTPEMLKEFADEVGGMDSDAWQREYLGRFVINQKSAIVPEFAKMEAQVVGHCPTPDKHMRTFVALDVGFRDATGAVFGYYDFKKALICIQDEVLLENAATDDIAEAIKAKEKELWGTREPYFRVSDIDLRLIADLCTKHDLSFRPVSKEALEVMVNNLRLVVNDARLKIDPRCTNLIFQLHTGTWATSRRTFERTEAGGHFDLVAALIYSLRQMPVYDNPYPSRPEGISGLTHYIHPDAFGDDQGTDKVIEYLFRSSEL